MRDNAIEVVLARCHPVAVVIVKNIGAAGKTDIAVDVARAAEETQSLGVGRCHPISVAAADRIACRHAGDGAVVVSSFGVQSQRILYLRVAVGIEVRKALAKNTTA